MLPSKKKLIPKLTKKLPPRPVDEDEIEEVDVDDEVDTDVDEEVEAPRSKKIAPTGRHIKDDHDDEDEEGEEEPEPVLAKRKATALPKKGKSALAKAFDSVPLSNSADDIPAGPHEVIIREATVRPFVEDRGQAIIFRYEFCEEKYAGQQMTHWFNVIDKSGEPVDWMINNLRVALAKLGIEVTGDELEETIQEINDSRPHLGVLLKLTYSQGKDGNTYPRFAIQGPCDNDVIEGYRDNIPY
jgi:hypothetical protein